MALDDLFADDQSKARTGGFGGEIGLENFVLDFRGNPRSRISYFNFDIWLIYLFTFFLDIDVQLAAIGHNLKCVFEDIDEYLLKLCGIHGCFEQVRWCVLSIGDASTLEALANLVIDIGDEVREIDGLEFERTRSRVVEDIGQEFFQTRDFTEI